jgi:phospholipid/cholesterol/gamma-HCH transport system substrate-binding protein
MSKSHPEIKVGFFVLICLVLLAVLLLQFSKGVTFFHKTYTIILNTANVGGLRPRASVLMSGVMVGTVAQTKLSPQGTNVAVFLKIYGDYIIRDDAEFKIEQSGFLGDQYVAIYAGKNLGKPLEDGAEVHAQEPFNIQEVARKVDQVIDTIRHDVINDKTLTNIAIALVKLRSVSEKADTAVDHINDLINSNSAPLTAAVSNLVAFADQLNAVGTNANGILVTNGPLINAAVSDLRTAATTVTNLLGGVQAGQGLVGVLLKDKELADNVSSSARSLSITASNLAITTGNLNRLGLWHFLWYHPKPEPAPPPRAPEIPGRNPFDNK